MENSDLCSETREYLQLFTKQILGTKVPEGLILFGIAILSRSITNDLDPLELIDCLKRILEKHKLLIGQNCALYLLADCIAKIPVVYLQELLSLSEC